MLTMPATAEVGRYNSILYEYSEKIFDKSLPTSKIVDSCEEYFLEIKNNSQGLYHQMAIIGLGYIHEAKGEFKNAIDLYKSVIDANTSFPLFQVYWSLARCHISNNDTSNALLVLREMQIKFSETAELEKIDRRIKQLST